MRDIIGEPVLRRDRKNPDDGSWYVYWTDKTGSREKSFKTKIYAEAQIKYAKWLLEVKTPAMICEPYDVGIPIILDNYLAKRKGQVSSFDRLQYAVKALKPFWGENNVDVISESLCVEYQDWRQVEVSTVKRELGVLQAAVKRAVDDKIISRWVKVFLPPVNDADVDFLTCHQARRLMCAAKKLPRAKGYLPIFLWIGFLTGRRKEAILSLKWSDVRFESGFIIWGPKGRKKTKKRRPTGAIPKRLIPHLLKHRENHPVDEYVISQNGKPLKDIKGSFAVAVRLAKIKDPSDDARNLSEEGDYEFKHIYPHMMRHSCATWLMQKGVSIRAACEFLGMTEDVLRRHYWKHHPDFQSEAANAL